MKPSNKQKWLNVIEFAVVGFATWFDPSAGCLIFLLKLCFQILKALQKDESPSKTTKKPSAEPDRSPSDRQVLISRHDHSPSDPQIPGFKPQTPSSKRTRWRSALDR